MKLPVARGSLAAAGIMNQATPTPEGTIQPKGTYMSYEKRVFDSCVNAGRTYYQNPDNERDWFWADDPTATERLNAAVISVATATDDEETAFETAAARYRAVHTVG